MTTTVPPSDSKIATPKQGAATVDDAWRLSDATGVPACTVLRALNEVFGGDSQLVR